MNKKLTLFSVFAALAVSDAPAQPAPLFAASDRMQMEQALEALAMTPADLKFKKDHGEPKWTLSWVTNALKDALQLVDAAESVHAAVHAGDSAALMDTASTLMELEENKLPPLTSYRATSHLLPDALPVQLHEPVLRLLNRLTPDMLMLRAAFSHLDAEDRSYLAASALAPVFQTEMNPSAQRVLADAGISRVMQVRVERESDLLDGTATAEAWLERLERIDRSAMHQVMRAIASHARELVQAAGSVTDWPGEPVRVETVYGDVVIGTEGADQYDRPALLIIDPGGDDRYTGGAGAANGLTRQDVAIVIDLAGDDLYRSRSLLAPGSALCGIAILYDERGNDRYEADYVGTAAGIFGGAWVEDQAGHDDYRALAYAQGAGEAGFGTLVDWAGNDSYRAGLYAQGFAGVMGWGLLADHDGNDTYYAGGVRTDSDRNEDRYLSLSQGFSIGARPHAGGGVGALVDLAGNDVYNADVYGQGVSYYYAAGFLLDAAGNDRYAMHQYGQGCGIHFSHGLLADLGGSDMYTGYILAQGAAHDFSVGMLFDHEGNDTYTADHHAQGRALNNAFAMLVDREGDDGYFGRQRGGAQGIGNEGGFRDFGSLALLLDLGGADIYSGGFSNGISTIRPLYGVVHDVE